MTVRPRLVASLAIATLALGGAGVALAKRRPPPAATAALATTTYRLANGLEVILAPDPSVTTAVVLVWYHVGSKDEVVGKTGFAHLFEHLMFEGSRHVGEGQFDALLEAAGGWNNGTTSTDRTTYFEQAPAAQLPLMLWLEADRMAGLWSAMNQGVLDNQRDVVKNERSENYENVPYGKADFAVQQALWPAGHGNHNLTIGTPADLGAASLADVEAFWRTYYRPSNATLVIAGGVDVAATRQLVDTYFAWMPTQARPVTRTLDAPVTPRSEPVSLAATDEVQAAKVVVAFRTDAPTTPAAANLEVAAQLLGGSKTSRLYRRLVLRDKLASDVSAYAEPQVLGGELQIHAIARTGVDPAMLQAAIDDELARLRRKGTTPAELTRATRMLRADRLRGLEDLASRADMLATWAAQTGTADGLAAELAALDAVTPTTLRTTVATWLASTAAVTMVVTPAAATDGAEPAAKGAP